MPPLAPAAEHKSGPRQRQAEKAGGAAAGPRDALARRSASFHGRGAAEQRHQLLRQRPRTQPDLLAGVREWRAGGDAAAVPWAGGGGRTAASPSKVLVTVAVQQSMWPLHVMARTEWRVADLVAAAVALYVREGRRPLLPSADASAFTLHYSQFSLQRLDPEEKLMELGSRSFFLCSKAAPADVSSAGSPVVETAKATASPAKRPNMQVPWLGLMHFWPLL
ncbi:hypothetical protein PR202_ga01570 [Eleusine coracana subsp. coracana]|uniref:DUF7054 domain-containing protein n=1 Tax=Eleusine coracana subsp. coracana TaxID=191504 RepID=A0AAV5BG16_ELECO|nr:hypothetical protein QOZ80_2AG0132620 [Eleusine coracana subsp. coracana]GJM85146.1 hypothetical protein PR202_ga00883 [Eleusine coracana subsp. coracana]GJM85774.1 hypothetical protein PR202_ga01570 [Eleusine coracana subsp. coracana]